MAVGFASPRCETDPSSATSSERQSADSCTYISMNTCARGDTDTQADVETQQIIETAMETERSTLNSVHSTPQ